MAEEFSRRGPKTRMVSRTRSFRSGDDLDIRIREIIRKHLDRAILSGKYGKRQGRKRMVRRPVSFSAAFPGLKAQNCSHALECAREIFDLLQKTGSAIPGQTVLEYMAVPAISAYRRRMERTAAQLGVDLDPTDLEQEQAIIFRAILMAIWNFNTQQKKTSFMTYLHRAVQMVAQNTLSTGSRVIRLRSLDVPLRTAGNLEDQEDEVVNEERFIPSFRKERTGAWRSVLPEWF